MTRNRKRIVLLVSAGLLVFGSIPFVLVWFQPQKLVIDDRVNEAAPTAGPEATATGAEATGAEGMFRPLAHGASGIAKVVGDTLRFEDFEVENGPDLFVYLSAADADGPGRALGDDIVDLGRLKGNIGSQNYAIPEGTDLEKYKTVVVWCRRFTVAFAAAELADR